MASANLDPRSSLVGAALGLIVGGASGFVAASAKVDQPKLTASPSASVASAAPPAFRHAPPTASGMAGKVTAYLPIEQARPSFAQQGEDLVIQQLLYVLDIDKPTYIDIGAHDPVQNSNSFLFYAIGNQGVLVEPNPTYAAKLRKVRPRDTVLEVGVGVTEQAEADYYVIDGDGQLNTFSKAQAESLVRTQGHRIERVVKRRLVPLNAILDEHFKNGAPDVLSIDIEGLDYEILKTLDWKKWRPKIVCVETSHVETGEVEREILGLMEKHGYIVRGGSFVNTIFLDHEAMKKAVAERAAKARAAGTPKHDGAPKHEADGGT